MNYPFTLLIFTISIILIEIVFIFKINAILS